MATFSPHLPSQPTEKTPLVSLAWYRSAFLALLVVVLLIVGVVGGWIARMRFGQDIRVVERPTQIFVPQDATTMVNAIDKKVLRSVLPVYRKTVGSSNKVSAPVTYIDTRDRVGYAVVLTTDGWIVSTRDVVSSAEFFIQTASGAMTPIEKIIGDPATPLVFVKIKASNLTPLPFAQIDTNALTALAAVPTAHGVLRAMIIDAVSYASCDNVTCVAQDIRSYQDFGLASPLYNGTAPGDPILNKNGEVLGIIVAIDTKNMAVRFVPASVVRPVMQTLFSTQKVVRAQLPFSYVDLSRVKVEGFSGVNEGALVTTVASLPKGKEFPLKKNDIILAVNGTPLKETESLSHLIHRYPVGTIVQMQITRAGKDMTIDLPLN